MKKLNVHTIDESDGISNVSTFELKFKCTNHNHTALMCASVRQSDRQTGHARTACRHSPAIVCPVADAPMHDIYP